MAQTGLCLLSASASILKARAGVATVWAAAAWWLFAAVYCVNTCRNLPMESRNFGISSNKIVKPDNSADVDI